ncbi:MAG: methionyl-tRNA formyltransferase [Actinomycetota bacterium]
MLRLAFAGDRDVAVRVLKFILGRGVRPLALLVPAKGVSHADQLAHICSHLDPRHVMVGRRFREPAAVALLEALQLDYLVCVHFPLIVPPEVLRIPRHGVLNLHPAYLPYNRGWHTPSWAILEGTPYGASLHLMSEEVDAGPVVLRKALEVRPDDTADTLYRRVKSLEVEVFREAWPTLERCEGVRAEPQPDAGGTAHRKEDLFRPEVQRLDPDAVMKVGEVIDRLRALTTDRIGEAAYLVRNGARHRIQIRIVPEKASDVVAGQDMEADA